MTPLEALRNLYTAARSINATAEVHDKIKECAVVIETALMPQELKAVKPEKKAGQKSYTN